MTFALISSSGLPGFKKVKNRIVMIERERFVFKRPRQAVVLLCSACPACSYVGGWGWPKTGSVVRKWPEAHRFSCFPLDKEKPGGRVRQKKERERSLCSALVRCASQSSLPGDGRIPAPWLRAWKWRGGKGEGSMLGF